MQDRIPHDIQDLPERCWLRSYRHDGEPMLNAYGKQMWHSRAWYPGEAQALWRTEAYTKPGRAE